MFFRYLAPCTPFISLHLQALQLYNPIDSASYLDRFVRTRQLHAAIDRSRGAAIYKRRAGRAFSKFPAETIVRAWRCLASVDWQTARRAFLKFLASQTETLNWRVRTWRLAVKKVMLGKDLIRELWTEFVVGRRVVLAIHFSVFLRSRVLLLINLLQDYEFDTIDW